MLLPFIPAHPLAPTEQSAPTFDGTNDQGTATGGLSSTGSGWSCNFWVRRTQNSSVESFYDIGGAEFYVQAAGEFGIADAGSQVQSTDQLAINTWYMVTYTCTGSTFDQGTNGKLYIDGSAVAGYGGDSSATITFSSSHTIGDRAAGSRDWTGQIMQVATWDSVLTASEITAIYNSATPIDVSSDSGDYASSADLQDYFKCDEGTGASLANSSGGGDHTVTGGPPTWANYTFPLK